MERGRQRPCFNGCGRQRLTERRGSESTSACRENLWPLPRGRREWRSKQWIPTGPFRRDARDRLWTAVTDARVQPVEIDLQRTRQLRIRWADGHEGVIPLRDLRRGCPCATCRAWREEQQRNPLAILQSTAAGSEAVASAAELVGHYALRIRWSDGHDTGIYDFGLLRRLSPGPGDATEVASNSVTAVQANKRHE